MKHWRTHGCAGALLAAGLIGLGVAGEAMAAPPATQEPATLFNQGADAYRAGRYPEAARAFRQAVALQPAAGTLQNLGNTEWQLGRVGPAILAWEQAIWVDPFNGPARNNLAFARKAAQIESPSLAWYEVVSSWLPADWWAWIAGLSLWSAVGLGLLPGILRAPKRPWHQALAAVCIAVFLLSLPAHAGVYSRSRIGFVLPKGTPLRLTPTAEAEFITQLAAGEPARILRRHGSYLLIRTLRGQGWVQQAEFGRVAQRS